MHIRCIYQRVVEQADLRVGVHGARERDARALPAGEPRAADSEGR